MLFPAALLTASVYVVVATGETLFVPPVGGVTGPTPLSIVALIGLFAVVHVSIEDWPAFIVGGFALSVQVGGGVFIFSMPASSRRASTSVPSAESSVHATS